MTFPVTFAGRSFLKSRLGKSDHDCVVISFPLPINGTLLFKVWQSFLPSDLEPSEILPPKISLHSQ